MEEATRAQIISILNEVDDMTIATVGEDGYPQATTVSFVNDGLTIFFGTSAHSQKARNIARCDKVSLTVNRDYNSWEEVEGLSIAGVASRVSDPTEEEKVGTLMLARFPHITKYLPADAPGEDLPSSGSTPPSYRFSTTGRGLVTPTW